MSEYIAYWIIGKKYDIDSPEVEEPTLVGVERPMLILAKDEWICAFKFQVYAPWRKLVQRARFEGSWHPQGALTSEEVLALKLKGVL